MSEALGLGVDLPLLYRYNAGAFILKKIGLSWVFNLGILITKMNFRDWLIVVGIVIILGILVDGYRRMRLAKQDSLKMSRNMGGEIESTPLDDDYNPELPGGGARIIPSEDDTVGALAEKLEAENAAAFSASDEGIFSSSADAPISADISDRPTVPLNASSVSESFSANVETTKKQSSKTKAKPKGNVKAKVDKDGRDIQALVDQEVIVINVDAKADQIFSGQDIKKLLEACGMDHGDMSIFHRHEEDDLLSPIQFSVANAVEPGYFDPAVMDSLETPGVSFFLSLPGPKNYMKAFDYMLETAQCFATNLKGELSDERRSVLTKQTIEHFRTRVRDFERKQLSRAKV